MHIVNLVAKIILHQFDKSKERKKKNNISDNILESKSTLAGSKVKGKTMSDKDQMSDKDEDDKEEDDERVLDKEEKELDEGDNDDDDDEDSQTLARDADIMEEAMEEEIEGAVRKAKPVCKVLFKVSLLLIYITFLFFSFFFL